MSECEKCRALEAQVERLKGALEDWVEHADKSHMTYSENEWALIERMRAALEKP